MAGALKSHKAEFPRFRVPWANASCITAGKAAMHVERLWSAPRDLNTLATHPVLRRCVLSPSIDVGIAIDRDDSAIPQRLRHSLALPKHLHPIVPLHRGGPKLESVRLLPRNLSFDDSPTPLTSELCYGTATLPHPGHSDRELVFPLHAPVPSFPSPAYNTAAMVRSDSSCSYFLLAFNRARARLQRAQTTLLAQAAASTSHIQPIRIVDERNHSKSLSRIKGRFPRLNTPLSALQHGISRTVARTTAIPTTTAIRQP